MTRRRQQRGGSLVEAALTLLVFFTFLFAILEFGRAYNIYHLVTNAAREGARFGVAPCAATAGASLCSPGALPSSDTVQAQVCDFLQSGAIACGANPGQASVSVNQNFVSTINGVPVQETQVTVSAPYSFVFFPFGQINLSSQAVMRNETQ
jgi:hypothetical protein